MYEIIKIIFSNFSILYTYTHRIFLNVIKYLLIKNILIKTHLMKIKIVKMLLQNYSELDYTNFYISSWMSFIYINFKWVFKWNN